MTSRDYRVLRTEELQKVWHPFFLPEVVEQARKDRAARIGSDNWDTLTDAQKLNAYMGVLTHTSRRVSIVIGDYSGDGHGQTETVTVDISGGDISDAALSRSFDEAVKEVGFSPYEVLNQYEDSTLSSADWDALKGVWDRGAKARATAEENFGSSFLSVGFSHPEPLESATYVTDTDNADGTTSSTGEAHSSVVALVMAFVGYAIPDFSWNVVPCPDSLVGGWNPLLKSPGNEHVGDALGYGVFS